MTKTLVIGDVHGHLDRLATLLEQEGIVRDNGEGEWTRVNRDVEVVQLGDLGHFGDTGSPTGDEFSWAYGLEWLDVILWGNHDRAVIDPGHAFRGYRHPGGRTANLMDEAERTGKLRWALARHGHLLTHAGLTGYFHNLSLPIDKNNPEDVAQWLNGTFGEDQDYNLGLFRNAIGRKRGGSANEGGILWRDIRESLYCAFPQVFGHTADHKRHDVRYCWRDGHSHDLANVPDHVENVSYCIDIGGKGDRPGEECLMGLWLPEGKIVRVDL